ncbi:MAG: cohesin domain-containing protein [Chloroflexi bacterium]|nr:cohesin domain-containing protein [Chloroflexota bacterium]
MNVSAGLVVVTPSPLPDAIVGTAYAQTISAQGGAATYSDWRIISGALPSGLALGAGGILSGSPLSAGVFSFTVQLTDSAGKNASKAFQLTVRSVGGGSGLSLKDTVGAAGGTIEVPLSLTSGGASVAAFQVDLSFDPQLFTYTSVRKGDGLTAASKDVTGNLLSPGTVRLTAFGVNQNPIGDGTCAVITLSLASTFPGSGGLLSCTNAQGVSPQSTAVALSCTAARISAGSTCTCDVNRDGSVNIADVQLMTNMALGLSADKCDLNKDGQVNVADVQLVINAAMGMACGAAQ